MGKDWAKMDKFGQGLGKDWELVIDLFLGPQDPTTATKWKNVFAECVPIGRNSTIQKMKKWVSAVESRSVETQ